MYGNPDMDVKTGYKKVMRRYNNARNFIFYLDDSRLPVSRRQRDLEIKVALFHELQKNISPEVAKKEMEDTFGKPVEKEVHVLGGKGAKPLSKK